MAVALETRITDAVAEHKLLPSTAKNIRALLTGSSNDLYPRVIGELIETNEWSELNDRFYKTLAFGTGGLRGRTIGKIVTAAERGSAGPNEPPEFPCVGTNAMNFFNINRATRGLVAYLREWKDRQRSRRESSDVDGKARQGLRAGERANQGDSAKPKLVIAHDTRFFSKRFADLAAIVAAEDGCDAFVFDSPRSTPELSFAVRYLRASAGIVITASHNPPHDNGYKVYFEDGAQVVEPHASGIIAKVNAIGGTSSVSSKNSKDDTEVVPPKGEITTLGEDVDLAYMNRLETLILDSNSVREAKSLRIIFTPLHGTGGVIVKPMLQRLGFNFEVVPEQDRFDGAFPTVESPNPENAEALQMGIELAQKTNADLVVATDPDCDRMGVAVRDSSGEMKLLTGNQIGSLIAYYRAKKFFELGILTKENAARGVIIKTFVTTDLQKAIAESFGLRCVETLTGFKYIGEKLGKYERELLKKLRVHPHLNPLPEGEEDAKAPGEGQARKQYVDLREEETRNLRLKHSSFYVFGGEESYGYSGADFVRDKDGNGSVIMFCEIAAYAKSKGKTVDNFLDEMFCGFGYFEEKNASLVFEGAEGADKIARLVESYTSDPPNEMHSSKLKSVRNFEREEIRDIEGDLIPKEKMSIFELEDRTRIAVRPSGTEPKIKYYLFAQRRPESGKFTATELTKIKREIGVRLDALWDWLQKDAERRLG